MFKWMISGHRANKQRQEKLNNSINNKNKNNDRQRGEDRRVKEPIDKEIKHREEKEQQKDEITNETNNNQENNNKEEYNERIEEKVTAEYDPPLQNSRPPPPPPSHPPPPIPSYFPAPPNHPPPPLPYSANDNEYIPQAPGTCTLPRRGLKREDPSTRYRSPSNPPSGSRHPPPYSRHQPPDPAVKPYQRPPPPKIPENSNYGKENCTDREPYPLPYQWNNATCRWVNRGPDSGFGSLQSRVGESGSQSLGASSSKPGASNVPFNMQDLTAAMPSKSTEDLLNASRVSPMMQTFASSPGPSSPMAQYKQEQSNGFKNSTNHISVETPSPKMSSMHADTLPSDGVYPQFQAYVNNEEEKTFVNYNSLANERKWDDDIHLRLRESSLPRDYKEGMGERYTAPEERYKYPELHELRLSERFNSGNVNSTWSGPKSGNWACKEFTEVKTNLKEESQSYQNDVEWLRKNNYLGSFLAQPTEKQHSRPSEVNLPLDNESKKPTHKNVENALPRRGRNGDGADSLVVSDVRLSKSSPRETEDDQNCNQASSASWMEWTQQLQAYVAWVNSQLRKKLGTELISDLRRDLQTGVVFADLIEIISGERVSGVIRDPDNQQTMRQNLDRVLQFMAAKRIRMANITSKEISEGNLKAVMRVILALAAHYKPQSVRSSPQNHDDQTPKAPKTHDIGVGPDVPSMAPDKTPNLSSHRRTFPSSERENGDHDNTVLRRNPSLNGGRLSPPVYENLPRRASSSRWAYDSLRASHKFFFSPRGRKHDSTSEDFGDSTINTSYHCSSLNTSLNTSMEADVESPKKSNRPAALEFWQDLQNRSKHVEAQQDDQSCSSSTVSADISQEQELSFRRQSCHRSSGRRKLPQIPGQVSSRAPSQEPSDNPKCLKEEDEPQDHHSIVDDTSREPEGRSQNSSPATSLARGPTLDTWLRSKSSGIDEKEDLKALVNSSRDQIIALKNLDLDGLLRNDIISSGVQGLEGSPLKQELLRQAILLRALGAEKIELSRSLGIKETLIFDLRKQLQQKDKNLASQRSQFEDAIKNLQNGRKTACTDSLLRFREEIQIVRDAISALRNNFRDTDPCQHTLDTLEQAISVLTEKSYLGMNGNFVSSNGGERCNDKRTILNGTVDASTKVIYFTERTVTPFMSTINKSLGEITLRDFKTMFDRPGFHRFHFKNHDPEYGMVKEEVIDDDDILPGVDGKIIAWVEEDND